MTVAGLPLRDGRGGGGGHADRAVPGGELVPLLHTLAVRFDQLRTPASSCCVLCGPYWAQNESSVSLSHSHTTSHQHSVVSLLASGLNLGVLLAYWASPALIRLTSWEDIFRVYGP